VLEFVRSHDVAHVSGIPLHEISPSMVFNLGSATSLLPPCCG
jgi:hypothetical protein